jgi:membrane-bound lytic murein transglycosylase D
MNKLLLFATSLISLTIQSQGATLPPDESLIQQAYYNDSLIKKLPAAVDPKDGFRNLFESASASGLNSHHLNPKAISFVEDYMDDHGERLTKMKSWGRPYFDLIGEVFTRYKLPVELKYLSVIESDLKSGAVSWAGAVGPWQLMPATARLLGLKVTRSVDERRDYRKSTQAAAKYLNGLYATYQDWLLVIAAYNCGPGNVNAAIRRSGSRNFWDLQYHLPTETRNHVKKFIATHYIMEGEGGLTTMTRRETAQFRTAAEVLVTDPSITIASISGKYTAAAIAEAVDMSLAEFTGLNPNFDKAVGTGAAYELRLPAEKMTRFQSGKPQILEQSVRQLLGGR